jgi:hypothetical protein
MSKKRFSKIWLRYAGLQQQRGQLLGGCVGGGLLTMEPLLPWGMWSASIADGREAKTCR